MMLALLALALVASALAQTPTPCSGPDSFTARFKHFDRERKLFTEGKMYYDHLNRRIREFEFMDINNKTGTYDRLKLYEQNTEYRVDLRNRTCNVTVPHRHWYPYGVPPEGRYLGSGTIGVIGMSQESVTVDVFVGNFSDGTPFSSTVTKPDCFLVEMSIYHKDGFEHREFYDVVSGIT